MFQYEVSFDFIVDLDVNAFAVQIWIQECLIHHFSRTQFDVAMPDRSLNALSNCFLEISNGIRCRFSHFFGQLRVDEFTGRVIALPAQCYDQLFLRSSQGFAYKLNRTGLPRRNCPRFIHHNGINAVKGFNGIGVFEEKIVTA